MLSLSRRTLLKKAPLAAASMTMLTTIPEILRAESLAAAPGIQLYTVGKELTEDLPGTLARISAIGYKTVESAGTAGHTAAEFRKALDAAGLKCVSSHFFDPGRTPEQLFEDAKTLGAEYVVSSVIVKPAAPVKSADDYIKLIAAMTQDDYKKMAAELNSRASQAKSAGLQFAYHNHNMEFQKFSDGATIYDTLMAQTDPSMVKIELDCGWADLGGRPPLEVFRQYPGRVRMLHIKDFAPVAHPVVTLDPHQVPEPTELGKGHIDYRPILAAAPAAGVEHIFVEQEPPFTKFTVFEAAKVDYEYLRSLA